MQDILDSGIGIILFLQQFSPQLDRPFLAITNLGGMRYYILALPLVYWCCDRRTGLRLAVIFLASAWLNTLAKDLACMPRPFAYDARVQAIAHARGGGFPSGHTQGAAVFWGYLALCIRRWWFWVVTGAVVGLVALSRLYLGVHFPIDLIGGFLLGALVIAGGLLLSGPVEAGLSRLGTPARLGLAAGVPLALLILLPQRYGFLGMIAGTLAGLGAGWALERRYVVFDSAGTPLQKAGRLAAGLTVAGGLLWLLQGLPGPGLAVRFIQYALLGLWTALGAPWLFVRLHLAGREAPGTALQDPAPAGPS